MAGASIRTDNNALLETSFLAAKANCSEEARAGVEVLFRNFPDFLSQTKKWLEIMDFTGRIQCGKLSEDRKYIELEGFLFWARRGELGDDKYLVNAEHLNLTAFILSYLAQPYLPKEIPHSEGVNWALAFAAQAGDEKTVARFLNRSPEEGPRPDQEGRNLALEKTAQIGNLPILNLLLAKDSGSSRPRNDLKGVVDAFCAAVANGHLPIVNRLMKRDSAEGKILSSLHVGLALQAAARDGHSATIRRLTEPNLKQEESRVTSLDDANKALGYAASNGHDECVDLLLDPKEGPRPNQKGIREAYDKAYVARHTKIARKLQARLAAA